MKTFRTLVVLAIVCLGNSLFGAPAVAQDTSYELGSGDEIRLTVFGHEDLSGDFIVGSDGTVSMPLIGQIMAKEQTVRGLDSLITDSLQPDYLKNPRVTVEVLNYRPFYILGEANSPGSYPYVYGMKVINAISLSGGYTYRAKQKSVFIDRSGEENQRLTATPDTLVLPGDIIRVPERFF